MEARRQGTTKSDLLVLAGQIDDKLEDADIEVLNTPKHIEDFQIDESTFEVALVDEVSYLNPRAREYDINSVRSIYVLRAGAAPMNLERSRAVLVTSNDACSGSISIWVATRGVAGSVECDYGLQLGKHGVAEGSPRCPRRADDGVAGIFLCGA